MKTYAVKVREILCETVLVEAEDKAEALDKVQEYNNDVGFDLDYIEDYAFDVLREATAEDVENCGRLEV